MKKLFSLAMTLVVLLTLTAVGCSKCGLKKTDTTTLRLMLGDNPQSIDPSIVQEDQGTTIVLEIFEGLTRYDPKTLEPLPGVAETWEMSPDGLIYTFHLRKDAKWSDGSPITANDFVYSWRRTLDPQTASVYAFILYPVKNAHLFNTGKINDPGMVGVRALDDATLEVMLENPTGYFLGLTSYPNYSPVPEKIVRQYGDLWTRPENIVSNGPFVLKKYTASREILLERNPNYWGADNVGLKNVDFSIIQDQETALKKYMMGELDILRYIPSLKVESLKTHPEFIAAPYLASNYFQFNTTKPPLNNIKIRTAINLAVDREKFCGIIKTGAVPLGNVVPTGLTGYTGPAGLGFDPKRAKELLAEAGYADPTKFPKLKLIYNTDERHQRTVEVLQRMWKENLGIDVELENMEWKVFLGFRHSMKYEIARGGWIGDYLDPNTFLDIWLSYTSLNDTGWKNTIFDTLIKEASVTTDAAKRMDVLKRVESILLNEAPLIPLFQTTKNFMIKPYVKGFYPTLLDHHPLREVYIEEGM